MVGLGLPALRRVLTDYSRYQGHFRPSRFLQITPRLLPSLPTDRIVKSRRRSSTTHLFIKARKPRIDHTQFHDTSDSILTSSFTTKHIVPLYREPTCDDLNRYKAPDFLHTYLSRNGDGDAAWQWLVENQRKMHTLVLFTSIEDEEKFSLDVRSQWSVNPHPGTGIVTTDAYTVMQFIRVGTSPMGRFNFSRIHKCRVRMTITNDGLVGHLQGAVNEVPIKE